MEYLSYYTLNKKPFQISTDPKFLWLGNKHQQALSILKYGIEDDKGFLLLTGDVGTGKTTLINAFVNSLEDDIIVARVSDPGLTKLDFINFVAQKFQMGAHFESKSDFLIQFTALLEQADKDQKKVLLIIDEAQHLTDEVLEEIRLLSNIENQDKKLLNIFLVGQNEFNASLEKYENRALRQRITLNYTLFPLEPEETKTCIEYRLGIAGCQKELFTPEAITAVHTLSEGFPRVINIICDHALFYGCQNQLDKITDETIWKSSAHLRFSHIPQTFQEPDFTESTDEDWLEASEVPPLSVEEIYKASQPLPDPEPELELAVEPKRKSRKYRVAVPIFIIAFLMSGFLVLDENKVESISQYIEKLYKETIASSGNGKATGQATGVIPQENRHLNAQAEPQDGGNSTEVAKAPEREKPNNIAKEQPQITPLEPAVPLAKEVPEVKDQSSTTTEQKVIFSTAVESTEPEIGEVPPTQPETIVTAPESNGTENNGLENRTDESKDQVAPSSTKVDQQSQSVVTDTPARDENVVLPEIVEKVQTPTVALTPQPAEPVSKPSQPATTELTSPPDSPVVSDETPTTTGPEQQTVEQAVTPEIIEDLPEQPSILTTETAAPKAQLSPVPDKPESAPAREKPAPAEDPGAVIDWLLESNNN